ncbi:GMC family oxidoreductase [Solimonas soli]|uniref:GMC family oxidoreductase n=1 Tax=Solimonas soli TaxID=413479 RepID=UPI00047F71C6|nr:GMC family oxidoreductase N-terminal domain-containing protein [Solimonas soli]
MESFDYVIVGAGAAGCVLAHRLSEDPAVRVALLEAGPSQKHPLIAMPKGLGIVLKNPKYVWSFVTEPEASTGGKSEPWARGKVLGGSTSVNGLMYVRGQPADFDEIAAQTSDDWSWQHIGAAYRALENHQLGADATGTRGDAGPLRITLSDEKSALTEAMVKAGVQMGLPLRRDPNAPDGGEGIGYAARNIYAGRRQDAATAFVDPVRSRRNLTVVTGAPVQRIRFEGRRAVAAEVNGDGGRRDYRASREIIVAGGALSSPALLQRSGIGPAALLQKLGIALVHDAPEVGQNLIEHRAILMSWKLSQPLSQNPDFAGWRAGLSALKYFVTRRGPMAAATYEIGAWLKSRPELARPDLQFLIAPFSLDFESDRQKPDPFHGFHMVAYPLRPTSRGEINIKSMNVAESSRLRPNHHATEHDRELMCALVRSARRYAAQPALREIIEVETYPGPDCESDAEIIDAYDRQGSCGYHAVGSCRMGRDERSVVDPQLRVRGVEGLRVMDTSVMPQIPSGNTNGPTMAMAWRAADIIRRDR